MKIRLVVSDVDGTLLDDRGQLSDANRDTIFCYQRAGGRFTLATGRSEDEARALVAQLEITAPIIVYNGARIVDPGSGRRLFDAWLPPEPTLETASFCEARGLQYIVYTRSGDVVAGMRPTSLSVKVQVIAPPRQLEQVVADLRAQLRGAAEVVRSAACIAEVLPPGVSKGRALEMVARRLGLPLDRVLALGNYYNDVSMLASAGLALTVAGAPAPVRLAADGETPSNNQDAVAWAIRAHCLADAEPVAVRA